MNIRLSKRAGPEKIIFSAIVIALNTGFIFMLLEKKGLIEKTKIFRHTYRKFPGRLYSGSYSSQVYGADNIWFIGTAIPGYNNIGLF
jgi:hypothetical protein